MSKVDRYRRIAERTRRIPGEHGLRPYRVFVVNASRSGAYGLEGTLTETETELLESGQPPKVRQLRTEELALNNMGAGGIEVGPITPTHSSGGIDFGAITEATASTMFRFRVVSPGSADGVYFRLFSANDDRALHYTLTLYPEGNVPA